MRQLRWARRWMLAAVLMIHAGMSAGGAVAQSLIIPEPVADAARRYVTVEDLVSIRRIDTLRLSPDQRRFAVLVRQADASANRYRMEWFVGGTRDGKLIPVGDGGDARLVVNPLQRTYNSVERGAVRWSADGQWIAYTLSRAGEVQLWRSRTDGGKQEQLTHNAGDVRDFEWSPDGKALYFTAGPSREELRAQETAKTLNGYHYDTDLRLFTDLMALRAPPATAAKTWVVTTKSGRERLANDTEQGEFKRLQRLSGGGFNSLGERPDSAFAVRGDGAEARAKLEANNRQLARMEVSMPGASAPIRCEAAECGGVFDRVWWGDDHTVLFLRLGGMVDGVNLHSWNITNGAVALVARTDDAQLTGCDLSAEMRMICVRETSMQAPHVIFVDASTSDAPDESMRVLVDVNPEYRNIALGKVERLEWDTPTIPATAPGGPLAGIYPKRAYGYLLYPPDFEPSRKYPVFISPYVALGFDNVSNREFALQALAASGFVVLNLNFPQAAYDVQTRLGPDYLKLMNSAELGFPHATVYTESTLRALDLVGARGFVDERRVGIGGVSRGAMVSTYMLIKHDRLAAVSIGTGTESQLEYYAFTPRGQKQRGGTPDWMVKPTGPGVDYWKQIDPADNVEALEAPILINTPAQELYTLVRLMKHMNEAGKPYDAYVFPQEPHLKWQPAHLSVCMHRNVDWFRFWLQSYEDPDPAKAEQYARWRKLREMQLSQSPSSASLAPESR